MTEKWRKLPGYGGRYEVSDQGKVRCLNFGAREGRAVTISQWQDPDGYLRAKVTPLGENRAPRPVHSLVLESFVGPCPEGLVCRHLNGDRRDNRLENLSWGTVQENTDDRQTHGTSARGERQGSARLTREAVLRLRALARRGTSWADLAKRFGVSDEAARKAALGLTWAHVPGALS